MALFIATRGDEQFSEVTEQLLRGMVANMIKPAALEAAMAAAFCPCVEEPRPVAS
jgi:hypothetical protein